MVDSRRYLDISLWIMTMLLMKVAAAFENTLPKDVSILNITRSLGRSRFNVAFDYFKGQIRDLTWETLAISFCFCSVLFVTKSKKRCLLH
jgi:hypothetical protein